MLEQSWFICKLLLFQELALIPHLAKRSERFSFRGSPSCSPNCLLVLLSHLALKTLTRLVGLYRIALHLPAFELEILELR